ncbi:hypothetical protein DOY81_010297 [Sarcophaga bullata]|nr:hypothetical protein DOY81_010297 [Sarcophaga bullata]
MVTKLLLRHLHKIQSFNAIRQTAMFNTAFVLVNTKLNLPAKSITSNSNINFVHYYSTNVVNNIPIVTYEEVKKLTKQSAQLLIDVREPEELQECGKIAVSINIPLGQVEHELGSAVSNCIFKARYGRDKPDKNNEIIFHCRSGKRSQKAAELARTLGYNNTKNYQGSYIEWAEKECLRNCAEQFQRNY